MRGPIVFAALVVLAGCSQPANKSTRDLNAFDVEEPPTNGIMGSNNQPRDTATGLIAYTYTLSYRLADADVATVQTRQTAICASLGPGRCRIVSSSLNASADERGGTSAETRFLIDARLAHPFIERLDRTATGAGGRVAGRQVDSEDVTKQVVDTAARVRAKQALADRLEKLIGTAGAKVGDLVAAERAFADTQQELDAARSLQATLRQRVQMSEVTASYSSAVADRTWGLVGDRLAAAGGILAGSVAALVTFVFVALPWVLLLAGLGWVARRRGWRFRWPRRARTGAE